MNNFKGRGSRGGERRFEGKKSFTEEPKRDKGPRPERRSEGNGSEQFSATCSECSKKCAVPFKPSQDKPVYCSACFGMKKSGNELRGSAGNGNRKERRPFGQGRSDHTSAPRDSQPTPGQNNQGILELKRQISGLEVKLNRILDLINPPMPSAKVPVLEKEQVAPEVAEAAIETPKKPKAKKVVVKPATKVAPKKAAPKKAVVKKTAAVKKVAPKKAVKKAVK